MVTEFSKGIESEQKINLSIVRKDDTKAEAILAQDSHVVLYHYHTETSTWERSSVEGTLFLYSRSEDPKLGVFILNRLMSKNYHRFLRENVQFLVKNQFLLIKEESGEIRGLCFSENKLAKDFGRRIVSLGIVNRMGESSSTISGHETLPWQQNLQRQQKSQAVEGRKKVSRSSSESSGHTMIVKTPTSARAKSRSPKGKKRNQDGSQLSRTPKRSPPRESSSVSKELLDCIKGVEGISNQHQQFSVSPANRGKLIESHKLLSLEQVEQELCNGANPKIGETIVSVSKATSDVSIPSPVIGTSEDFPENPPLLISAGMTSDPVNYQSPNQRPSQPTIATKSPPRQETTNTQGLLQRHTNSVPQPSGTKQRGTGTEPKGVVTQVGSTGTESKGVVTNVRGTGTGQPGSGAEPGSANTRLPQAEVLYISSDSGSSDAENRRESKMEGTGTALNGSRLMSPNAFLSQVRENKPELTKEELLQAMMYLLKNDESFVDKLHDAYKKSVAAEL